MQDYGLVSIITPTWACADFIAETIRSIQVDVSELGTAYSRRLLEGQYAGGC